VVSVGLVMLRSAYRTPSGFISDEASSRSAPDAHIERQMVVPRPAGAEEAENLGPLRSFRPDSNGSGAHLPGRELSQVGRQ
jgi:hypothetical protein